MEWDGMDGTGASFRGCWDKSRWAGADPLKPFHRLSPLLLLLAYSVEIVHIQGGQCGNQIGAKFWEGE